jgi:HD-like signal output (HDOD) protein
MTSPLNDSPIRRDTPQPAFDIFVSNPQRTIHPLRGAFEEYCFKRFPEPYASQLEEHVLRCCECRRQLEGTRLSIDLIRHALQACYSSESRTAGRVYAYSRSEPDETAIKEDTESATQRTPSKVLPRRPAPHRFGPADLIAARDRLPVSHLMVSQCLSALNRQSVDVAEIESIVSRDPVLCAHLMKVANSALLNSGHQIRSIGRAIMQIGFERARLHVLALSVRRVFAAPQFGWIWNHSIDIAEMARQIARISGIVPIEEAGLMGLVHDIGHLVLIGLGEKYRSSASELRARGIGPVEIEWQLCGASHAQVGADLLEQSHFPGDMVEAVRHHHAPSVSELPLTSVLFLAESFAEHYEDIYDPIEHSMALHCLGLKAADLRSIQVLPYSDLEILRFAA